VGTVVNIIVSGGTAMLPGFGNRLLTEINAAILKPKYEALKGTTRPFLSPSLCLALPLCARRASLVPAQRSTGSSACPRLPSHRTSSPGLEVRSRTAALLEPPPLTAAGQRRLWDPASCPMASS
jgi:hypothetical protein